MLDFTDITLTIDGKERSRRIIDPDDIEPAAMAACMRCLEAERDRPKNRTVPPTELGMGLSLRASRFAEGSWFFVLYASKNALCLSAFVGGKDDFKDTFVLKLLAATAGRGDDEAWKPENYPQRPACFTLPLPSGASTEDVMMGGDAQSCVAAAIMRHSL